MLQINGKTFMNLQEAVQWLLDNNALPFQSSANYVANTEIGMGTIVNPSPAKVRIGSLIFFADSKVSTVIGLTENGFICSDHYNNLVDDVAYVTNVAINASGHLITTMSDGQTIDAGLIKQVSGFSINGSQHLIVTYNDGSTTDLGAIFNGNISISGNLSVGGDISSPSIVETMTGYSFTPTAVSTQFTLNVIYAGVVKNGNKITFVIFTSVKRLGSVTGDNIPLGRFTVPASVYARLYPYTISGIPNVLSNRVEILASGYTSYVETPSLFFKASSYQVGPNLYNVNANLVQDTEYIIRQEITLLLSDNLAQ